MDKEDFKLTESKVSNGRLSRCRLMTAFPSRWTSFMFSSPKTSSSPAASFFSLSFSGTSLNIHSSEPGAKNASKTCKTIIMKDMLKDYEARILFHFVDGPIGLLQLCDYLPLPQYIVYTKGLKNIKYKALVESRSNTQCSFLQNTILVCV